MSNSQLKVLHFDLESSNIEWFDNHLPVSPYASAQLPMDDEIDAPVIVYNLQGIVIGKFNNEKEAISSLKKGIYVINHRKIIIE